MEEKKAENNSSPKTKNTEEQKVRRDRPDRPKRSRNPHRVPKREVEVSTKSKDNISKETNKTTPSKTKEITKPQHRKQHNNHSIKIIASNIFIQT